MLFSVLDSTKNLCFTGIKQFRVLVRTGPRLSRETRHITLIILPSFSFKYTISNTRTFTRKSQTLWAPPCLTDLQACHMGGILLSRPDW